MAHTADIYFSQFWRLEVQEQGAGQIGSWWELSSWLADGLLLTVSSHGRERERKRFFLEGQQSYRIKVSPLWFYLILITS